MCISAGIAAAGAIGGSLVSANAAGKAADTQSNAALSAAQLQSQDAQKALDFQKQQFATAQQNIAPWLQSGGNALQALNYGLGLPGYNATPSAPSPVTGTTGTSGNGNYSGNSIGSMMGSNPNRTIQMSPDGAGRYAIAGGYGGRVVGPTQRVPPAGSGTPATTGTQAGSIVNNPALTGQSNPLEPSGYGALTTPWTQQFQAPTNVTEQNDPGYQFRLQQGEQALQRSAAAQGNLLTGNTARDIQNYGQDYASNEYGNVYNRALGQYMNNYNIFSNNQANAYNRLASAAGVGQVAANQLAGYGQNASNNVGNILLTSGAQQGQNINNAAAARASGYVGGANALSSGLSGATSSIGNALLLKQLLGSQNLTNQVNQDANTYYGGYQ